MKPKVRTSRRVSPLKDSDIDHEIILVDQSGSAQPAGDDSPRPGASPDEEISASNDATNISGDDRPLTSSESRLPLRDAAAPISDHDRVGTSSQANGNPSVSNNGNKNAPPEVREPPTTEEAGPPRGAAEQAAAAPAPENGQPKKNKQRYSRHKSPETAIDILYENERGGFLCGIPLFASAALGNLDPPPWTNSNHKPSPTSIKTAQPPDPSWEWAWPEWRVNQDDAIDTDHDGWEYSFMFSKKFSWHGPKWYNSFVRRRAWIRRRIKKGVGYQANDPHLLNPEYFTVEPAAAKHVPLRDGASSILDTASRTSACVLHEEDAVSEKKDVESVDMLMVLLRVSRIDREKLDAVQSYLEHAADDWLDLQNHMHEIMSIFVFQASRRLLLTRLMGIHDDVVRKLEEQKRAGKNKAEGHDENPNDQPDSNLEVKVKNLAAAVTHADEEVRRLEYWSDVKGMAEGGESGGAVAGDRGWEGGWEGVDQSGAIGANRERLP
ncbi:meiotically up-regulated protein [Apiospora rasikravindrae]|uniref:Meiotically up-regulated protein n=1 Tax=Apiospora rasikravindrae TaxID=990691 RepID=A0ABR1TGT5_9PEZI